MDRHEWTDKTTGKRWAAVAGAGVAPYGAAVASKAVGDEILRLAGEKSRLRAEAERLAAWLGRICGGDHPCTDENQLRQWAYEAVVLKHPCPEEP